MTKGNDGLNDSLDVLGEMDFKLDELSKFTKKAASAIVFLLLIHTVLLALILSFVIWRPNP